MPHKDPEAKRLYMREYVKRVYQRDKARRYAATLRWRSKNKARHLANAKRYRDAHPDRVKESMRRVDQLPHRKEKNKIYWATLDKSIKSAWEREWRRRRKLKVAENGGTCTVEQWESRCRLYGNCCAYCSRDLTQKKIEIDHVIPVAKGGSNWPSNLVPACRSCNARKSTKPWRPKLPECKASGQSMPRMVTKES